MRGRNPNRSKGPNPLTRSYESNGPDVKIRGTAQHIADKYAQLARDAQASGDPVGAENYLQHAEHYYRIIATAQEQYREQFGAFQRPGDEDGDEEGGFGYGNSGDRNQGSSGDDFDIGSQPQPYDGRQDGGDRQNRFDGRARQDRGDRFEGQRPDRGERPAGPDRQQDRGDQRGERQDRGDQRGFDRGGRQDRPPQRFDRADRPDADRQDRGDRQDRQDRGERQDRPDHRGERQDRGPERFPRNDRPPRQDFQRQDGGEPRDTVRADGPRPDAPRPDAPRSEAPRPEPRPEPSRPARGSRRREESEEDSVANGLPAFLTNPVRVPIASEKQPDDEAPAAAPVESADGEANGAFRQRRRRRPRFEENGAGTQEAGPDISPEGVEPPGAE